VIRHLYALLVVTVGWVLFRATTLSQACGFLGAMAGLGHGRGREFHPWLYLDTQLVLALVAGILGSAPVLPWLAGVRDGFLISTAGLVRSGLRTGIVAAEITALWLLLLASAMLLAAGTHNPFIYFRF
jgi:alginate O-acetyltransferase complex protein AlgI